MKLPLYTFLRLATALVALFLLAACSDSGGELPTAEPSPAPAQAATPNEEAADATEEKVLTILYWQAPTLPGPYLSSGTKDSDAGAITLEPLARYDPDGNLTPALATEIPTLENGDFAQDLMSITWKLRRGLKWSDGRDVTADDVVFTWRY